MSFLAISDLEVDTLWWISIAVAFVVVIVAMGLLTNILVVARNIGDNVKDILGVAARIAGNTSNLALLVPLNSLVRTIRDGAVRIDSVAAAIADHARVCRHDPFCVSPRLRSFGGRPVAAPAPPPLPASAPLAAQRPSYAADSGGPISGTPAAPGGGGRAAWSWGSGS